MAALIKNLINNRKVVFDTGKFDNYCVYIVETNGEKEAPLDVSYFSAFLNISRRYPDDKVYDDFVSIYDLTTSNIDQNIITLIDNIVNTYEAKDQNIVEQWFAVIYTGMIAEEN